MIDAGVFDGFDWNTHPALFGYAATLATLMWVIWRFVLLIERMVVKKKQQDPETTEPPDDERIAPGGS